MFRRKTETRKNGPIKAMQPAIGGSDNNTHAAPKTGSKEQTKSSRHQRQDKISKDDIVMAQGQTKEKIITNPYATIKMWRPTATENSTIIDASTTNFYQSFTNFDALRNANSGRDFGKSSPLPVNDLRNAKRLELSYHGSLRGNAGLNQNGALSQGQMSRTDVTNHKAAKNHALLRSNGHEELPADYSIDTASDTLLTRISLKDEITTDYPLPKEVMNGDLDISHSPHLPSTPTLHNSPQMAPFTSLKLPPATSVLSSSNEQKDSVSYQVVSDGTTNSIKLVLSHSYTDIDLANMDLERLSAELKLTMDLLRTSHNAEKNSDHLQICLTELHSQTKQFIHDAKLVVSSANNSHEKMINQLESAVHTLAHVFLHGQATMLLMTSPDQALHLGFQIIKAVNSFKSTINAGSLALGKALNDPNMKYLMRQAQNLAALLASLLNTIKEVEAK